MRRYNYFNQPKNRREQHIYLTKYQTIMKDYKQWLNTRGLQTPKKHYLQPWLKSQHVPNIKDYSGANFLSAKVYYALSHASL